MHSTSWRPNTSWRPEGWQNPYIYHNLEAKPIGMGIDYANVPEMVAYERGADAMLEALRNSLEPKASELARRAIAVKNNQEYKPPMLGGKTGKWVFIPDDEKEQG